MNQRENKEVFLWSYFAFTLLHWAYKVPSLICQLHYYIIISITLPLTNSSRALMLKRLNTVRVHDFITDGSQKVKDTHEAHCRGINPVGYPFCVYGGGSPWERRHQRLFLNSASYKERPPTLQVLIPWRQRAPSLEMPTPHSLTYRLPGVHSVPHTPGTLLI